MNRVVFEADYQDQIFEPSDEGKEYAEKMNGKKYVSFESAKKNLEVSTAERPVEVDKVFMRVYEIESGKTSSDEGEFPFRNAIQIGVLKPLF